MNPFENYFLDSIKMGIHMAFCFQNINRSPYSVSCNRHRLIILKSEINLELFSSVQFSPSVVSDSLQPHEPQHARPPYISPNPRVHSNPCPSSQWCHPTISSSVIPFSFPHSFPASGSFQMSQLFASGGQSFSFNITPSNEHLGLISFRMDWLYLLAGHEIAKVFSNTTVQKHQFFSAHLSL